MKDEERTTTAATPTAKRFLADLAALRSEHDDGLPMRVIFALAKEHTAMPPAEIERVLERREHEARVGAVSIMDFQARRKQTPPERREELYDLYLRRHDRIDTWDLVDRSAPYVVGGYLDDKSREPLYELARSDAPMERRTAITATYFFIRHDDLDDTFGIAEILADDEDELVQKAVGGWIREAGKRDEPRLLAFLEDQAATMPRTALRYAVEKLDADRKAHYLGLRDR